jgi:membrane AbrB-like protein
VRPWRDRRAWLGLAAASIALALLLEAVGLPAAWLLAAMGAAIVGAVFASVELSVPGGLSAAAQALIGCLIAHAITPGIFATLLRDWPLFLATTTATIVVSALLGYLLARWRVVPGTVAIWGSTPGGATAMVIMAQAWGADARLVAVMVYLRVVMVAGLASCVALLFARHAAPLTHASPLAVDPAALLLTLAVSGVGMAVGRLLKLPAGALLCAMAIGAALNLGGIAQVSPPRLLLLPAYLVIGWRIGLGFTRETLAASARALPRLILAAAMLLAFGGAMAALLVRFAGIDPLTAYLATSPGGMDAVAVIASTSAADVPFVMALQVVRFLMVMIAGPTLAGYLARRAYAGDTP